MFLRSANVKVSAEDSCAVCVMGGRILCRTTGISAANGLDGCGVCCFIVRVVRAGVIRAGV
jgi:hypothetical protein